MRTVFHQIENNREKLFKKNQTEILKLKRTIIEMKKSVNEQI